MALFAWQYDTFESLVKRYQQGQLHHAILLVGPKGIGKRNLATILAQRLICQSDSVQQACGVCKSCKLVQAGYHPDMYFISPEDKSRVIKISQIRDLTEKLASTAQQDGNKVVVLEPADMMNSNAANALLKSLEEPTPKTFFILVADTMERLLPTIRSRCHLQRVNVPSKQQGEEYLRTEQVNQDALSLALLVANNCPLRAKSILNPDLALTPENILDQLVRLASHENTISACVKSLSAMSLADDILPLLSLAIKHTIQLQMKMALQIHKSVESLAQILVDQKRPIHYWFELDDVINQTRSLLMSTANPQEQLMLEDILIRLKSR